MSQGGLHATRGFSTAQLLELLVVGLTKTYIQNGQIPTVTEKGVTRQVDLALTRDVSDKVAQALGISFPAKTKMHVLKPMVKAGWFENGQKGFAPKSAEGQALLAKRAQIYQLAQGVLPALLNPANYRARTVGGVQHQVPSGGELDEMLTSSYSWGEKRGITLQQRLAAVQQVWGMTTAGQEPAPAPRFGGGGFGQPRAASRAQADLEINQSNGFLNKNVAKFLAKNISKRATSRTTQAQAEAAARVGQALRQILGLGAQFNLSEQQAALVARFGSPGQSAKPLFDALVAALGGPQAAKQTLWAAASTAGIKELVGGFNIITPNWTDAATGRAMKSWVHLGEATGANPETGGAAEFTRYVYNQLFDRYVSGNGVDRQSADAAAKSSRRTVTGPRGLLGSDDVALKGLNGGDAKKVAHFIGKARKGLYTMQALRDGAEKLGIKIDQGAVLHEAVIQSLADNVVRAYSQNVGVNADQTMAVAAALGINGFSKGIRTAEQLAAAKGAILRKLDAQSGHLTAPCNAANYKKKDIKRIAKAHGVATEKIKTVAAGCAALAEAGVQVEAPSQDVISSGRRAEMAKAHVPSQAKSKSRRRGSPVILEGLAATNLSPGRAGALAPFIGGQMPQQPQAVFPVVPPQPLSPSRSPGGTRRAPSPTLGGGLGGLLPAGGGVSPRVIATQPGAGAGLQLPTATGGNLANLLAGNQLNYL